ncbi:hypothetical protein ACQ4PT_054450 [Festuca glaucescens]
MSANDNGDGTSKGAMSVEEEARVANAKFWQVSQQEEVEAEVEEVVAARRMSEGGEEDEPTTTDGDHTAGDDTTTDGGDRMDDGSANPAAKKKKKERKDRKPTVLANTTDEITKDEELAAAHAEDSSSQGSTEPWDRTFNRVTNAYKKRPKFEPPMMTSSKVCKRKLAEAPLQQESGKQCRQKVCASENTSQPSSSRLPIKERRIDTNVLEDTLTDEDSSALSLQGHLLTFQAPLAVMQPPVQDFSQQRAFKDAHMISSAQYAVKDVSVAHERKANTRRSQTITNKQDSSTNFEVALSNSGTGKLSFTYTSENRSDFHMPDMESVCKVFLTPGNKGWGLRAAEELPRGTFVCEYAGEILTNNELYERNNQETANARHTYPVYLNSDRQTEDILEDDTALCLDATFYGNVARFINHRCNDANIIEVPVEIETPDHHYYHIAFFTKRKIKRFEELTWLTTNVDMLQDLNPETWCYYDYWSKDKPERRFKITLTSSK